jgi:hypothetical protein
VYSVGVNPSEFAPEDLSLWHDALLQQREAEARLAAAVEAKAMSQVIELLPEVDALRTVADLLLAEAVRRKCDSD